MDFVDRLLFGPKGWGCRPGGYEELMVRVVAKYGAEPDLDAPPGGGLLHMSDPRYKAQCEAVRQQRQAGPPGEQGVLPMPPRYAYFKPPPPFSPELPAAQPPARSV